MKKKFNAILTSDSEGNKSHNTIVIEDDRIGKRMRGFIYDIREVRDKNKEWIEFTLYTSLGFDISFLSEFIEKGEKDE